MKKQSAGLLLYRAQNNIVEVFLVHPGGPFWARKDDGAWSIPKGEFDPEEDPKSAAYREFGEETGLEPEGNEIELGVFTVTSSKQVHAWAIEADVDPKHAKSNMFTMEWPPKSGQEQTFPEVDKAAWFTLLKARQKLVKGQVQIVEKLAAVLGVSFDETTVEDVGQTSLF